MGTKKLSGVTQNPLSVINISEWGGVVVYYPLILALTWGVEIVKRRGGKVLILALRCANVYSTASKYIFSSCLVGLDKT